MIVKLLTKHHLEFLGLKGCCRGSSESTLVKMSNCWKSHAAAQLMFDWNSTSSLPRTEKSSGKTDKITCSVCIIRHDL